MTDDGNGEWKLVTQHDKKRVMKKRGSRQARNECKIDPKVHHQFILESKGGIEDQEKLYQCLKICVEYLLQTDFYKNFATSWDETICSISTDQKDNDDSSRRDNDMTVREIVCYGIGNFSRTSLIHYSAPLWQLAYALCLRQTLEDHFPPCCDTSIKAVVDAKDSTILEPTINRIPLVFYDPCTTPFERTFLRDKIRNCVILDKNERGNRRVNTDRDTRDGDANLRHDAECRKRRYITLFFMPHCPAKLYENVVWANWDSIIIPDNEDHRKDSHHLDNNNSALANNESIIFIIGNSLNNLADPIGSCRDRPKCPCLYSLLPFTKEIPIKTSKHDTDQAPGNLFGSFNDTYLCFYDVPATSINLPSRPYDSISEDTDDKELI